ncbi:MAG TPA: PilZ domain-containing protein [Terriglobales bacterium]|nr:PilZ domain-containing protein [Terriglobales bacterium]
MANGDPQSVVCQPGQLAPASGIYLVKHLNQHRAVHEVLVIRGEEFPLCRTCRGSVRFRLEREVDHVHHDWDLAGPMESSLAEQLPDFDSVRAFRRVEVDLPITLESRHKQGTIVQGHTTNLSEGGLGAVISERFADEKRNLTIRLPGLHSRKDIQVSARLRYRKGMRHGFEFMRVSAADREAIRELCAHSLS